MRSMHFGKAAILFVSPLLALLVGGCPITDSGNSERVAPVLDQPRKTAPRQDTDVYHNNLRLSWTNVNADRYDIYFGIDTNPPLIASVTTTSYVLRELPECTLHHWRVVAVQGQQALSSATYSFKTDCPDGAK